MRGCCYSATATNATREKKEDEKKKPNATVASLGAERAKSARDLDQGHKQHAATDSGVTLEPIAHLLDVCTRTCMLCAHRHRATNSF